MVRRGHLGLAGGPAGLVVTGAAPRAAGVRIGYDQTPERIRDWVDDVLGSPVKATSEQVGGMSPGCATRVLTANGRRAFVKAVGPAKTVERWNKAFGPELNPVTPDLFRHEALVLRHLGANTLWAELLEVYDEPGGWVALVLEDVAGGHPDITNPVHVATMLAATDELTDALAGQAATLDIATSSDGVHRWTEAWPALDEVPSGVLPGWVRERAPELESRHRELVDAAAGNNLVQNDIRNDNLILRANGSLVFVDWGMARRGASWVDPLIVRLEWVEQPVFDDLVAASPALKELGDEQVTTFLVALGVWLAHRTTVPMIGLPTMDLFRRTESARLLEGARRRLGR